ncbi:MULTISPECIES: hypothetical protein [unclassified Rhizobium]|uniref:hypothetical protein n=1 Tax=unclassified Rhizobium TaxID=2613769 RepID=UPI00160C0176|nr:MULTISPECIES: hypothetical protein [unclassified Rhizobium]MBB3288163.1 hypothetical protein [Rhizobium sp. BK252]MBB3402973.1 hypothetical protein [Rhizobium sp. BK289]MBB3415550.1 hypothetical protein [Rhizobium sp. BK284]MBB3483369.1 hypothetical protein [Rhizobium sp. BK347]
MPVQVITPPAPIVTPADIPGGHAADDATIVAMIAAVTEDIDGPGGWLGRSLGKQTLELTLGRPKDCSAKSFPSRAIALPYLPVIANAVTVKYLDLDLAVQTVDPVSYKVFDDAVWFNSDFIFPAVADAPDAIRIRYDAGYGGSTGNGSVPERARQTIILCVQDLMRLQASDFAVRSETVEGVGATNYLDQDRVSAIVEKTCERLLARLWVPVL